MNAKDEPAGRKKDLREEMLGLRDSLSEAEIARRSVLIGRLLFELPEFRRAGAVMFYVSFRSEVRTQEMIQAALELGKKIIVPAVSSDRQALEPFFVDGLDQLAPGAYGILEPKDRERRAALEDIDLIAVPGCAFDPEGYRLGYGGGYYDRFLSTRQTATAVGLAFELQIIPDVPRTQNHDIPVDLIVTEKRVIDCRRSRPA